LTRDKIIGAILLLVAVLVWVFYTLYGLIAVILQETIYGEGKLLPPLPFGIQPMHLPAIIVWLGMTLILFIVGWIGWTLATTPPPEPLEELEELEKLEEEKAEGEKKEEEKEQKM